MHEMSLCEGIRDILEAQARAHSVSRITRVRIEIGRFAGVEKPALAFAWEVVMRGSAAEGSDLVMIDLPGRAMCFDCGREVEIAGRLDPCPECGGGRLVPNGGDEMRIKDLEAV
ncbi:hydrogenase maturation nickel metallochaperone HypA [Roseibacterium sp. SDUM158016]|uniref:hydrogenase maturation nickel metallochaperone HypA n=1 Tax=Roseicyclus sediminis TaxID=2980997 RepID=UPI0021D2DAD0|nr:hydrogenase maturation nickel metallochaperone HypA [Roseibacterium sp. SDUM158016]MCU4654192.1 hydrogenase maturation nickel metallochaperone HypA [Roseibacterium sp. SDUM158016]